MEQAKLVCGKRENLLLMPGKRRVYWKLNNWIIEIESGCWCWCLIKLIRSLQLSYIEQQSTTHFISILSWKFNLWFTNIFMEELQPIWKLYCFSLYIYIILAINGQNMAGGSSKEKKSTETSLCLSSILKLTDNVIHNYGIYHRIYHVIV